MSTSLINDSYHIFMCKHNDLVNTHISSTSSFLNNSVLNDLCIEYENQQNSEQNNTLNVFKIISDLYFRENFHSDLIRFFLDPEGEHHQGNIFLFAFIDTINCLFNKHIQKQDYLNVSVEREPGRIDILIFSKASQHCIIIENKLNNAFDMPRQLPRYYEYAINTGYKPDAIVYIPLDENKSPDMIGWTVQDRTNVLPLLCVLPGYRRTGVNLVSNWIIPNSLLSHNIDCISILRQYGELIKSLTNNNMDKIILHKFYASLKENKSLETALSIKNMLSELPIYMADRLFDTFNACAGDYKVWKYKPNFCGILFLRDNTQYKIDIWTSEDGYSVYVFSQNENGRQVDWVDGMKSIQSFIKTDKEYKKTDFTFYDEEKVIVCVNEIIAEINGILTKR